MKLTIENIIKLSGRNFVKFSSATGNGIAFCQENITSYNGEAVSAEIDINKTFEIEKKCNLHRSQKTKY